MKPLRAAPFSGAAAAPKGHARFWRLPMRNLPWSRQKASTK